MSTEMKINPTMIQNVASFAKSTPGVAAMTTVVTAVATAAIEHTFGEPVAFMGSKFVVPMTVGALSGIGAAYFGKILEAKAEAKAKAEASVTDTKFVASDASAEDLAAIAESDKADAIAKAKVEADKAAESKKTESKNTFLGTVGKGLWKVFITFPYNVVLTVFHICTLGFFMARKPAESKTDSVDSKTTTAPTPDATVKLDATKTAAAPEAPVKTDASVKADATTKTVKA